MPYAFGCSDATTAGNNYLIDDIGAQCNSHALWVTQKKYQKGALSGAFLSATVGIRLAQRVFGHITVTNPRKS